MNFFKKLFHVHQRYIIEEVKGTPHPIFGYKVMGCRGCDKEFFKSRF